MSVRQKKQELLEAMHREADGQGLVLPRLAPSGHLAGKLRRFHIRVVLGDEAHHLDRLADRSLAKLEG